VDDGAMDVPVPVLSVQPLVENAIKDGVAQSAVPVYVHVRIEQRGGELRIIGENSRYQDAEGRPGAAVGLQNVRRRLDICYGPGAPLRLEPHLHKTTAEICIPLVTASSAR